MLRRLAWLQLLAAATIGAIGPIAAVGVATTWGIGASPDSVSYLAGARSLSAGEGFSWPVSPPSPITHFPPVYSAVLAAIGLIGIDPQAAARWLAAVTFAANVIVVGWLLAKVNGARPWPGWTAVLGMLLTLSSPTMLEIHTMAWTEPTFILLGMAGFMLLARWLEERGLVFLILGALVIGLSSVTRYAGAAYWGTGVLAVFLLSRDSWAVRLKNTCLFAVIGAVPICVWVARNLAVADTATNRTVYLHVPSVTLVWEAVSTVSSWLLLPNSLPTLVRAVLVLLVFVASLGLYLASWPASSGHEDARSDKALPTILWLFILFVPVYGAILLLSNSVVRAYTPMEGRILSPLYPPLLILLLHGCHRLQHHAPARVCVRALFGGIALLLVGLSSLQGEAYIRRGHQSGLGFNSSQWHQSKTLEALRTLRPTGKIYSNAPEAIYVHLGRLAEKLPQPTESGTRLDNPDYVNETRAMQREINDRGGLLALFDLPWRNSRNDEHRVRALGFQPFMKTGDGLIYAGALDTGGLR